MADGEPNVTNRDQKTGRRRLHLRGVVETPAADTQAVIYDGIGAQLKAAREQAGLSCAEFSARLRIREPYLHAIEDGRFNDLPGPVYAVGFIRSYADAVGLDGEDFVFRFKQETAARPDQTRLRFPAPEVESRLPSGRLLVLSLFLVGAVYAGWYYLSNVDRSSVEQVPAVPERLLASSDATRQPTTGDDSASAASAVETDSGLSRANAATAMTEIKTDPGPTVESVAPAIAAPAAVVARVTSPTVSTLSVAPALPASTTETISEAPVPQSAPATITTVSGPITPATSQADATSNATPVVAREDQAAADATPPSEPATKLPTEPDVAASTMLRVVQTDSADDLEQPRDLRQRPGRNPVIDQNGGVSDLVENGADGNVAPDSEDTVATAVAPSRTADADIEQPTATTETELAALSVPEPPTTDSTGTRDDAASLVPRSFGSNSAESRVTLTARLDSWVQVVSDDNELLLTRILRAGDTYYVPNRPGLLLLTGNAGALEVSVDGLALPPIGPIGAVRRNVSLDPEALLGTARQGDQ